MSLSSAHLPTPEGPVSGAPNLPEGFTDAFTDAFTGRYTDNGEVRLQAVIRDDGLRATEQAPEGMLAALPEFLAPYREDGGGSR